MSDGPVIVTGAQGFIGKALCARFAESQRSHIGLVRGPIEGADSKRSLQPIGDPIPAHPNTINSVAFNPDGSRIVSGGAAVVADRHAVVLKSDDGSVTTSGLVALDDDARLKELSRMMAGLENSDAAQAHAEELLALAAERHKPRRKSRSKG